MKALRSILLPVAASLVAIVIGAILVAALGYHPLSVYASLVSGAFGSPVNIGNTLTASLPLIIIGLGIAISFQSGLFNIGADGQYWMGATAAAWVGYHFTSLPGVLHMILCLVAGMIAGALWAAVIPGLTKAFVGAHEVITTMMMSYIAILFARYLIEGGPMQQKGYIPQSPPIAPNTQFPYFAQGFQQAQLSPISIVITVIAVAAAWFLLYKTTLGFSLRSVGLNARAARYAGIGVKSSIVTALGLSGLFAGLAGSVQMLGVDHQLLDGFSSNYGYTAIVVALLARNNPIGVVIAGLFFGALTTGGQNMQIASNVPASLTDVLTGLIIFFVGCERIIPQVIGWYRRRRSLRAQTPAS
ncbi:ABC transporter permease [Alicyclobacillus mali]|uniref:ABC transporter permease n=1 Tax=Alicyclobacillus mali (ex Roth et al. 2021) TaxID=1123961 RepID=A0ABS0F3M6_9BACL|nr:ABC transporter permease [Alicyclobacillus mali (ex Roth et al. 2021)]MBF8377893.1 ABC transporter permease [Alicyclobacillus mali (ex Roth et al. 2021)]